MKRPIASRNNQIAIKFCLVSLGVITSMNLQAEINDAVQVGRYSVIASTALEAQVDLLEAVITIEFPEQVQTLGGAIKHLLQGSGYQLANTGSMHPEISQLFDLPLPDLHRSLELMTRRDALLILVGSAFTLVQDPVHRLIAFESCSNHQKSPEQG